MRLRALGTSGRQYSRFAAILAATTFLAGCSSGATRFSEGIFTDDIFTGSTSNQRAIIRNQVDQPYPGDAQPVAKTAPVAMSRSAVEPVTTGSVQRGSLPPAASVPVRTASAEPNPVDRTVTYTAAPQPVAAAPAPRAAPAGGQKGWSSAGGTEVTVRPGETVHNLSKRFGVPSSEILKANGMASADQLAAGQKVVIPTYAYSRKAGVSAPDANPKVAEAKSSSGTRFDVPTEKAPLPKPAPVQQAAVLPQAPKERDSSERQTASTTGSTSSSGNVYTVVAGDSLYAIAKKTGVSATDLKAANGLSDGHLQIGQKLTIPAGGNTRVAKAAPAKVDPIQTGATKNAAKEATASPVTAYTPPKPSEKAIREVTTETAAIAPDATGIGRMRWPARGRIIEGYGRAAGGKVNDGIDIAVPEGTPVKAAENGVVIYAGDGLKEFGNTVLVRHEDGLVTVYGHTSKLKVSRGDTVRRGQEIAVSGMSGSADRPKLHFEVRKDSSPVDPTEFLE